MSRQSWPRSSTRSRKTKTGHLQENVYCGSSTCWTMLHKKMKTARNKRGKKQPTLKADKQTKQIKQVQTNGSNKTFYYGLIMLILCFKFKVHFIESQGKKINQNPSALPQFWLDSVRRAAPDQDPTTSSPGSVKLLKPSRFVAAAGASVWCVYFRNITYYSVPNLSGFSALNVFYKGYI